MDIIICTYNNADLLERTLATIANQQVSPSWSWSVLVVDNNCTDHTAEVVESYLKAARIPGLRYVLEPQQGLAAARLSGLRQTHTDWIAFVDDDCLLAENWVEHAMQFAAEHPQCGAFGGKVILQWEQSPSPLLLKYQQNFAACDRGNTVQQLSRHNFHIPGAGMVLQRRALVASGWQDRQFLMGRSGKVLSAGDDSEIVLRILNAGYELWYTPDCALHHWIPTQRMSAAYVAKISYGFGIAAPYIASLRWYRSYWVWLLFSLLRIFRYLLITLGWTVKSFWRPNLRAEGEIIWNWTKGQIDSLSALLTQPKEARQDWLSIFKSSP
jgi:glucosyl-dolichyl phosphate glucuronosyltransferase